MSDWPEPDQDTWLDMLDMPEPEERDWSEPYEEDWSEPYEQIYDNSIDYDVYEYHSDKEYSGEEWEYSEAQLSTAALEYEEHLAICEWHSQQIITIREIEEYKRKIEKYKRKVILKAEQWMLELTKYGIEFNQDSNEHETTFKDAIHKFAKERGMAVCINCTEFEYFCPTCYTCVRCHNDNVLQGNKRENQDIQMKCRVDICRDCGNFGASPHNTPYGIICECGSENISKDVCYNTFHLNLDNADTYNNWGVYCSIYGSYEKAISNFDTAINLKPDYALAYYNRGNAKAKLGQYEDAIIDYDTTISLKSDYVLGYHNRGVIKTKLDRYNDAIQDYDTAIHYDPNCAELYHSRGLAKSEFGKYDEAIQDYDTAINLEIASILDVHINRGNAKAKLGQFKDAIADYDIAIRLAPNYSKTYLHRGILKSKLGQYKDAITDYDSAIKFKHINPADATVYGYRGLAKALLGQSLKDGNRHTSQKVPQQEQTKDTHTDEFQELFQKMQAVTDREKKKDIKTNSEFDLQLDSDINSQAADETLDFFSDAEEDLLTALELAKQAGSIDHNNEDSLNLLKPWIKY